MLGANKATDSTALALRRLVKGKPLAGHIGLEKRKMVRPAFREMNVRACSHQENLLLSRCEGEGYAKTISFSYNCERSRFHARCRLMRF